MDASMASGGIGLLTRTTEALFSNIALAR